MNNIVINADCLEALQDMPDKSIDCIVTSPPYWKGFAYEAYFNSYAQYLRWCERWLKECKRVLKDDENNQLRTENELLTKELEEIKLALQVEEHDNEYNCAEKDKLKAENARLRAVLQGIANNCSNAPEVARRVLNENK